MANMNEFDSEMTAGQILRAARTTGRRKRELNTVARVLCIKEESLDALENDDFAKIGELVYILGFARNYAMELELDPYVIVGKIKKQMGLVEEEDEIEIEGEEPAGIADKAPRPAAFGNWMRKKSKAILIASVSLAIIGAAGLTIVLNRKTTAAPAEAESVDAGVAGTKFNMPVSREYGLRNKDYANIVLQATGTTWVQIKNVAGNIVFEHSMVAGDVYYALNGSVATIGNAGALDVWVNGQEIPKLGADHQRLLDVVLSPENLMKGIGVRE
jgi:hypothetical protein